MEWCVLPSSEHDACEVGFRAATASTVPMAPLVETDPVAQAV
jgi:hypothetical protein